MDFTDTNFLSLDYMLPEMIELHRRDMEDMRRIVLALGTTPTPRPWPKKRSEPQRRTWKS